MESNIAARVGRWSATHRKTAIWGWIAFVLVAVVLGGAAGTKTLAPEDAGNGESKVASQAIAGARFDEDAQEQVLVQVRSGAGDRAALMAGADDVASRLERVARVHDVRTPADEGRA